MNYSVKDTIFSQEEFENLKWCVGEYRRVCREQAFSEFGKHKLAIVESILCKLNDVEWKNKNIK